MQLKEYINYPLKELAGRDSVPLVEIRESFVYEGGQKTDKRDGVSYGILLPSQACEKLRVKVSADVTPAFSQEELDEANKSLDFVMVSFSGFQIKPYSMNDRMQISAKADSIKVLGQLSQLKEE